MGRERIREGDRVVVTSDPDWAWTRLAVGTKATVIQVNRGACPSGGRYNDAHIRPDDPGGNEVCIAINRLRRLL